MIYDHNPHPPYFYLGDRCKLNKNIEYKYDEKDILNSKYRESYHCALSLNLKILNFVKKIDPTALIVFQSDSGWNSTNNFTMIYHKDLDKDYKSFTEPMDNLETIHTIIQEFN